MRSCNTLTLSLALTLLFGERAHAQMAKLDGRVDGRTRAMVEALIDTVSRRGLPREFVEDRLVRRALQGLGGGVSSDRLNVAVRLHARQLELAARVLGTASPAEIDAAVEALHAGVPTSTLELLRGLQREEGITVPTIVLVDLMSRGVSVDTASTLVLTLAASGTTDVAFQDFRVAIARGIARGELPLIAAAARTRIGLPGGAIPGSSSAGERTSTPTSTGGGPAPRAPGSPPRPP